MRSEQSLSDEWVTPDDLYKELCTIYQIHPDLDVACNSDNCKCYEGLFLPFEYEWLGISGSKLDVWCNPPHSKNKQFVKRSYEQWKKHNINIMMILPTNTMSSIYWHDCIEGIAETHPIKGRIRFLYEGKPAKDVSRNAYVCIIWRKK